MLSLLRRTDVEIGLVSTCALLLLLIGQNEIPIINGDEARFAEAAREMSAKQEYVVPTFGGVDRYDKPILSYWLTQASYRAFGVSEWTARFPSNLAAAAVIGLVAWSARRRWGVGAGWLSGLTLLATPVFQLQGRACTADMAMMLPTTVAMLALARFIAGERSLTVVLQFWLGLAFSVLAKGPVGPVFVVSSLVALWAFHVAWTKRQLWFGAAAMIVGWFGLGLPVLAIGFVTLIVSALRTPRIRKALWEVRPILGLVLMVVLIAPWAIAAQTASNGEYFKVAVGRHVLERSTTALEGHGGFPLFYAITALVAAFPWIGFVPSAAARAWRRRERSIRDLFLLAWLVGPFVVFELLGTKLVHYWMPSYPAGVLLVVGWLVARTGSAERSERLAPLLAGVGGSVLLLIGPTVVWRLGLIDLALPLAALSGGLGLGVIVVLWLLQRRPTTGYAGLVAIGIALLMSLFAYLMPVVGRDLLGFRVAERIQQMREGDERIVVFKLRDEDMLFYLPLDSAIVWKSENLTEQLEDIREPLVATRTSDVERWGALLGGEGLEVVDRVAGVDLGRGRWDEVCILRRDPGRDGRLPDSGRRMPSEGK